MTDNDINPKGDTKKAGNGSEVPEQGISPQNQPPHSPDASNYQSKRHHKPTLPVRLWRIYRKRQGGQSSAPLPNVAEKVTVLITAIIALCTATQALIYWQQKRIMEGSTGQTNQLISAANTQAGAAQSFAASAQLQATAATDAAKAMADQVGKLQAGVTETHALAKAARDAVDTNIRLSDEDRRAWVGVQAIQCENCIENENGLTIGRLYAVVVNTGKTPAFQMRIFSAFLGRQRKDGIPDVDSLESKSDKIRVIEIPSWLSPRLSPSEQAKMTEEMHLLNQETEPARTTLAPNATANVAFMDFGGSPSTFGRKRGNRVQDEPIFYAVAKISYYDIRKEVIRSTKICLMNDFAAQFKFCPTGNDMN